MTTPPWLALVGIGEDGADGLSPAARRLIEAATLVMGGARHLALAGSLIRGDTLAWSVPLDQTIPSILARRGQPTCVLASGDPFHYGIGVTLLGHVSPADMICFPQPSAFSLAAARLGWPLQDCELVSVHGRALNRIIPHLHHGARLLVLSWDGATPGKLAALLDDRGYGGSHLFVLERLGGTQERIRSAGAAMFDLGEIAALNIVGITVEAGPAARPVSLTAGLPDDWFEHDGQLTKAPIRAVTLASLAPHPGEMLWDVGAGSGSISIEWLLAHPSTRAVAFERDPVRAARIRRNADTWGVAERLELIEGHAPDGMSDRAAPHAIFIGGGLTTPGLLDVCRTALRPAGRLVANAVTIEGGAVLHEAMRLVGGTLLTLSIAQAEPVGRFHGFRSAMPVTHWRWVRPRGQQNDSSSFRHAE